MNKGKRARGIDVVILCGGKGERLRSIVKDLPKSMAKFDQRPFLSILMEYVASFGFQRFILCTGYMAGFIKKYYSLKPMPWEILYSEEKKALGTGGAIKKAKQLIQSNPFLVMNGDSFCQLDLGKFIDFHLAKKALVSMALAGSNNNKDCGKVILDSRKRIVRFEEKMIFKAKHFDSAGIYLFKEDVLSLMPASAKYSLERGLFPKLVGQEFYGYITQAKLIDIGTPKRYAQARRYFCE